MFWTVFASYGLWWVLSRLFGRRRMAGLLERVHVKSAERLATGFMRLRGVFIKIRAGASRTFSTAQI